MHKGILLNPSIFFFFKEKIYFKKVFLAMVETTISGHAIDSNAT